MDEFKKMINILLDPLKDTDLIMSKSELREILYAYKPAHIPEDQLTLLNERILEKLPPEFPLPMIGTAIIDAITELTTNLQKGRILH